MCLKPFVAWVPAINVIIIPTKDVSDYFHELLSKDPNMSPAVAAIQTLLEYIKKPSFGTVSELREKVVHAIDELTKTDSSVISVKSGCEMLLRFITLTALDSEVSNTNQK